MPNQINALGTRSNTSQPLEFQNPTTLAWVQGTATSTAGGNEFSATLAGVTAGTYAAGSLKMRVVGFPTVYYNPTTVTVTGSTSTPAARQPAYLPMDGDSISTTDQSQGDWHADWEAAVKQWLASKTDAQLATAGLTADVPTFGYFGISGQSEQQMDSAASDVDGALKPGFRNLLVTVGEPYNGTRTNQPTYTPQQAADAYNLYCQHRKAAGFTKVVSLVGFDDHGTGYTQPSGGYAAVRDQILAKLDAQKSAGTNNWDAIGKVDPVFDQTNAAMSPDGIHSLKAGYTTGNLIARLIAALDQAVFNNAQPAAVQKGTTTTTTTPTTADPYLPANESYLRV